jgi:hypothetical protein
MSEHVKVGRQGSISPFVSRFDQQVADAFVIKGSSRMVYEQRGAADPPPETIREHGCVAF